MFILVHYVPSTQRFHQSISLYTVQGLTSAITTTAERLVIIIIIIIIIIIVVVT